MYGNSISIIMIRLSTFHGDTVWASVKTIAIATNVPVEEVHMVVGSRGMLVRTLLEAAVP